MTELARYSVGSDAALWEGEMRRVQAGPVFILLMRVAEEIHAFEDSCPHQSVPLSRTGRLCGSTLTCLSHDWTFDVRSGQSTLPLGHRLRRFPVRVIDGEIYVEI